MFGTLGAPELVVILVVCLLLFGTKRLPELGKSIGEGIRGFKKAMSDEPEDGRKTEWGRRSASRDSKDEDSRHSLPP